MKRNDLSRCLAAFDQNSTIVAVVELSLGSWLVRGLVPGLKRQPLKKLSAGAEGLLALLVRWRREALEAGPAVGRGAGAVEARERRAWARGGVAGVRAGGSEGHGIHASRTAVSREHRRAKTDRIDTQMLMRAFLGWLRGEAEHCRMVAIPTLAQEDAKRPNREHESLVGERTRLVNR